MITKLDSLTDISTEFGVPLPTAAKMNWYYGNKNPASPVQPVMGGGGRIKDWIGYNHHASNAPQTYPGWDIFLNYKHFTYFREKAGLSPNVTVWTKLPEHQGKPVKSSSNYLQYVGDLEQLDDGVSVDYRVGKRVKGMIPLTSTNIAFYLIAELGTIYQNHSLIVGIDTSRSGSLSFGINILNSNVAVWKNGSYSYIRKNNTNISLSQLFQRKKVLFALSYLASTYGNVVEIYDAENGEQLGNWSSNGQRPNFLGNTTPYSFGILTGDGISATGNVYKIAVTTDASKCLQKAKIEDILNELNSME